MNKVWSTWMNCISFLALAVVVSSLSAAPEAQIETDTASVNSKSEREIELTGPLDTIHLHASIDRLLGGYARSWAIESSEFYIKKDGPNKGRPAAQLAVQGHAELNERWEVGCIQVDDDSLWSCWHAIHYYDVPVLSDAEPVTVKGMLAPDLARDVVSFAIEAIKRQWAIPIDAIPTVKRLEQTSVLTDNGIAGEDGAIALVIEFSSGEKFWAGFKIVREQHRQTLQIDRVSCQSRGACVENISDTPELPDRADVKDALIKAAWAFDPDQDELPVDHVRIWKEGNQWLGRVTHKALKQEVDFETQFNVYCELNSQQPIAWQCNSHNANFIFQPGLQDAPVSSPFSMSLASVDQILECAYKYHQKIPMLNHAELIVNEIYAPGWDVRPDAAYFTEGLTVKGLIDGELVSFEYSRQDLQSGNLVIDRVLVGDGYKINIIHVLNHADP